MATATGNGCRANVLVPAKPRARRSLPGNKHKKSKRAPQVLADAGQIRLVGIDTGRVGPFAWTSFAPPRPAIMVCFAVETHAIDQANAQPRTRSATAVGWRCPLRSSLIAVPCRVLRAMDPAGFSPLEQIDDDRIALARTGSTRNPARQVIALAGGVMARFCGPSSSREPARTICALRWPS